MVVLVLTVLIFFNVVRNLDTVIGTITLALVLAFLLDFICIIQFLLKVDQVGLTQVVLSWVFFLYTVIGMAVFFILDSIISVFSILAMILLKIARPFTLRCLLLLLVSKWAYFILSLSNLVTNLFLVLLKQKVLQTFLLFFLTRFCTFHIPALSLGTFFDSIQPLHGSLLIDLSLLDELIFSRSCTNLLLLICKSHGLLVITTT